VAISKVSSVRLILATELSDYALDALDALERDVESQSK
jgi:hypothetical protein